MLSRKKILVVDDEEKIVDVIKSYLINAGFDVYGAYNGKKAVDLFDEISPSLVILDLMLPDMPGEEVCKTLRKKSNVPVIMLTAKVDEENVLRGFNIGADDYVTKPFSPKQLVARVMALLRRTEDGSSIEDTGVIYDNGDLIVDDLKHEVKKASDVVNLTPTEYKILMNLIKYHSKVFTREELVNAALGDDYDGFDRIIDTHIKNLRQKIETNPKEPKYIITVHGVGYRFGGE